MFDYNTNSLGDPQDGEWIEALLEDAGIGLLPIENQALRTEYAETYNSEGRGCANHQLRQRVRSDNPLIDTLITHGFDIHQTARYLSKKFVGCCHLDQVGRICDNYGLNVPNARTEAGIFLRAQNPTFWKYYISSECLRYHEGRRRDCGLVRQGVAKYVSDHALEKLKERDLKMREFLETQCIAESDQGDICTAAELVDKSTSTPHKRGIELMIRSRGFEEYAAKHDHPWTFLTITAPPAFHAYYKDTGKRVASSQNVRPDECHKNFFTPIWKRCRSALNRNSVQFYGFKVCEPHHDGTPHWHMLVFCESEQHLSQFKEIVAKAFSPDNPDDDRRVRFEDHDPNKGGAADYIGKYIGKNISGKGVEDDEADSATRAQAWARVWGFHQFEQLGGPPVGVYRDLRKVRDRNQVPNSMLSVWETANSADWCAYIEQMGGPFLGNKYPIKNVRGFKQGINGEMSPSNNGYGEPLVTDAYDIRPVIGLACEGDFLKTYDRIWTLKLGSLPQAEEPSSPATEGCGAWTCVNNCTLSRRYLHGTSHLETTHTARPQQAQTLLS